METLLTNPEAKPASFSSSPKGQEGAEPDRKVIAQELKAAREKAGLAREQARKLLGHHDNQYFYRWEGKKGGKRTPSLATAIQLCIAYRCTVEELVPSLWRYFSQRIEPRRVKLAEETAKPKYRREVEYRKRKQEVDVPRDAA